MATLVVLILVLSLSAPVAAEAQQARVFRIVSPASVVGFEAQATRVGAFSGQTRDVQGEIAVDPSALVKGVRGTISANAASLNTGIWLRDSDLQAVMETARYPVIRFTVTEVQSPKTALTPGDEAMLTVTGTMEIHGVQRTVQIPALVRVGAERIDVRGGTSLRLTDYGIRPPRVFFVVRVRDEIRVHFTLVAEAGG